MSFYHEPWLSINIDSHNSFIWKSLKKLFKKTISCYSAITFKPDYYFKQNSVLSFELRPEQCKLLEKVYVYFSWIFLKICLYSDCEIKTWSSLQKHIFNSSLSQKRPEIVKIWPTKYQSGKVSGFPQSYNYEIISGMFLINIKTIQFL